MTWAMMHKIRCIAAFDLVVERFSAVNVSFSEQEALQENFWGQGEDARLREDYRFRQTPGGRWIVAGNLYANDELRKLFNRKHRSSLPFEAALAELGTVGERNWVFCRADKRFILQDNELRLSEQELTDSLLAEDALEMEKFVSHLPIRNLKAVAASEPEGEWGPTAQEEMGDVLGWVRVAMPGVVLNDRMFVARIKGHSMDDGRHGIVDGSYSLFELWPAGSRQGKIILVRGSFHDPETGNYSVKKYSADQRDAEGRHARISLVSLNPDKGKYPDIELDPEDDQAVVVIAQHIESLSGRQYGREPKPAKRKRSGRRNLSPDYVKKRLQKRAEHIFGELEEKNISGERERGASQLVCLDFESGGLHIETRPLKWLPNFVKKLAIQVGGKEQGMVLGSNLKNLTWRQMVPASRDEYSFTAPDFEDDVSDDLQSLALSGLSYDSGTVFKVDAAGIGRKLQRNELSPGRAYRILIPPVLRLDTVEVGECHSFLNGWQLWDITLPHEIIESVRLQLADLELKPGKVSPQIQWAVVPPVDYQQTVRGRTVPCFHVHQPPVIKITGETHLPGELTLFVRAGSHFTSLQLSEGQEWLVQMDDLPVGPVLIQLLHKKTSVAPVTLPFFVAKSGRRPIPAQICLQAADCEIIVGTEPIAIESYDLNEVTEDTLQITGPPLWPVHTFWQENVTREVERTYLSKAGGLDTTSSLARTNQKRMNFTPGNWVFDFAELGRVVIEHGGNPDPDELLVLFNRLLQGKEQSLNDLVGQYQLLKQVWFEPLFPLMGLSCQEVSEEELHAAPGGTTALVLYRTVRQNNGHIEKEKYSILVLVSARELITQKGTGSTWEYADYLCKQYGVPFSIVSNGIHWMQHGAGKKMKDRVYALLDIIEQEHGDEFENFLSACGGW